MYGIIYIYIHTFGFINSYTRLSVHLSSLNRDLGLLISSVFSSQIFESGFVHCDPHIANVLWRKDPRDGSPQIVLVDHGLYKQLDDDFRLTYARLWKALMLADIPGIKEYCGKLGIHDMYPLLASMLTSRPFDEIKERSDAKTPFSSTTTIDSASDKAMIRSYAQRYLKEIIQLLDQVPRQMLLLFKMNDCLRHINHALGCSPTQNIFISGKYATTAIYKEEQQSQKYELSSRNGFALNRLQNWCSYVLVIARIRFQKMIASWIGI